MLNRFYQLPLAQKTSLIAAAFSLLSCVIVVSASHHSSTQIIHKSATMLGESLIQQLSRDASAPLVQDDKLSLQALLNKLVNNPIVTHGVIYDVENQAITESGQQHNGLSLSASITYQDSIAGYAVITLNLQPLLHEATSYTWQLLALSSLLTILIYLLASIPANYISSFIDELATTVSNPHTNSNLHTDYPCSDELQNLAKQITSQPLKNNNTEHTPPQKSDSYLEVDDSYLEMSDSELEIEDLEHEMVGSNREIDHSELEMSDSGLEIDSSEPDMDDSELAILSLDISNLEQLQHQMSPSAINELLNNCYQQLCIICKLYDGKILSNHSHRFSAQFLPIDNEDNYPFRALCAGYLFQQWIHNSHSPLLIDIGLALKQSTNDMVENPITIQETAIRAQTAGENGFGYIVTTDELYNHPSVKQRVNSQQLQNENYVFLWAIEDFIEPYQHLLLQQLNTLNNQHSSSATI